MSVKSVIEVDVNDDAFKAFAAKFEKYRESLKKLPGAWKEVGKETESTAENYISMTSALLAQQELLRQSAQQHGNASRATKGMVRDTAQIAKNIGGATINLLKWVGIGSAFGGLLGVGGLFGLAALANNVGNARRSAQGLGVTTAAQSSFGVNYGRYVDTGSNLENIAGAKSDYSRRWAFGAMGVNPDGKDPVALAVEMAVRAKSIFDRGGGSQQEAQAHGLLQFYTMDELRRLHATSMADLRASEGGYRRDIAKFARQDDISKKWQDFSIQLKEAGLEIQNLVVTKLGGKVIPAITKVSEAFVDTIARFVNNKDFGRWIDNAGESIGRFAKYVGSPEFQTATKQFAVEIVEVAKGIHEGLKLLGLIQTPHTITPEQANSHWTAGGRRTVNTLERWGGPTGRGWGRAAAAGLAANFQAESNFNPFAVGDGGKAYGLAQWHPHRQRQYERLYGHTMQSVRDPDAAYREQLGFANWELTKGGFKAVGDRLSRIDSARYAADYVTRNYEMPAQQDLRAVERGRMAQALVTIQNNTGGSVSTTVTQMAQ